MGFRNTLGIPFPEAKSNEHIEKNSAIHLEYTWNTSFPDKTHEIQGEEEYTAQTTATQEYKSGVHTGYTSDTKEFIFMVVNACLCRDL